jgi:hypothetical protein
MDGWILFRPEALSLKGLGTLTTVYNKLSEVLDSSKVSITSHIWVRLGTSWIGAHVPTATYTPSYYSTLYFKASS